MFKTKALTLANKGNRTKRMLVLFLAIAVLTALAVPVIAADETGTYANGLNAVFSTIVNLFLTVFRYVGIFMVLYGIYQLVRSIMNDNPEAQTRATTTLIIGVVLTSLGFFLRPIFNVLGFTI